ncbi:MAG: type II toxin-antitoxin system VapC family toxin [Acidobacteriota bacterium]
MTGLYCDTSALVKLYVEEDGSDAVHDAVAAADYVATASIAYVEARCAFARKRNEGAIKAPDYRRIVHDLDADWPRYLVLVVRDPLLREAAALADRMSARKGGIVLRAYDSIHLAAALRLRASEKRMLKFAAWDVRLREAARRRKFTLLPQRL